MKNIKYFKYWYKYEFEKFLKSYGYSLDDVAGFKFGWKEQYRGNILKVYMIYFNDGEYKLFRVAFFKSFNECNQCRLGIINNKLLMWYDSSNIKHYKLSGKYILE